MLAGSSEGRQISSWCHDASKPTAALPDECGNVRGITSKMDHRFSCATVTELNTRTGPRILLQKIGRPRTSQQCNRYL